MSFQIKTDLESAPGIFPGVVVSLCLLLAIAGALALMIGFGVDPIEW